jgi:hypothetical protein
MVDPPSKRCVLNMRKFFPPEIQDPIRSAVSGFLCLCLVPVAAVASHDLIVVTGHPGEPAFAAEIDATAKIWEESAKKAGHAVQWIAPGADSQHSRFHKALAAAPENVQEPLWVVLLGHGNAHGTVPRFNLEGPDLNAEDLSRGLARFRRPVIVVAGFACAGAFLKPLAAPGRVVIAATRTGAEENWTRFPKFFANALSGLDADANGDQQVSVLEAWQHAARATEGSYKEQGRLATEHSVLDDLGDGKTTGPGLGMKAARLHLVESPAELALTPAQRLRRESLELQVADLRHKKTKIAPDEYVSRLEKLLLRLADVYAGRATEE